MAKAAAAAWLGVRVAVTVVVDIFEQQVDGLQNREEAGATHAMVGTNKRLAAVEWN